MDDKEFDNWMEAYRKTQGFRKFENYVKAEMFENRVFLEDIQKLRRKFKIPPEGFVSDEHIILPPQWIYRDNREKTNEFGKAVEKICNQYAMHSLDAYEIVEWYVFYNDTFLPFSPSAHNLLMVSDLAEEKIDPFSPETQKSDDLTYPIAIRLSPYATLRDILDFVQKTYKYNIAPLQKRYQKEGVTLGKFKKRKDKIRQRNELIYQHRHLPRKAISELLYKTFPDDEILDYGYIGKIISLEKKRRKEV